MGVEHSLLDTLASIARNEPTPQLAMPDTGFGADTPNQKALRCAVWGLQLGQRGLRRLNEFYDVGLSGHFAVGRAEPEPLSPTHSQLWYAANAGHLLAALRAHDDDLFRKVRRVWQIETAACVACSSSLGVRTPGARAYINKRPALVNSVRDKVIAGLANGWKRQPRVNDRYSYDVAIVLLSRVFSEGVKPLDLIGDDYSPLTTEYGFNVERDKASDDYFAYFDHDFGGLQTIYGVGVTNGELLVREDCESAVRTAERFTI